MGELKKVVEENLGSIFTINPMIKKNILENARKTDLSQVESNNVSVLTHEDLDRLIAETGTNDLNKIYSSIISEDRRKACINPASYDRIDITSNEEVYDEVMEGRIRKGY